MMICLYILLNGKSYSNLSWQQKSSNCSHFHFVRQARSISLLSCVFSGALLTVHVKRAIFRPLGSTMFKILDILSGRASNKPTTYAALRQSNNSTEGRLSMSENDCFHDDLHTKECASEDGYYDKKPAKSRFRWTALFFHLGLVTVYSVAFISAIYRTSKNGTGMKHLIKCKLGTFD